MIPEKYAPPSLREIKCYEKYGGFFKVDDKRRRITEIDEQLQSPELWNDVKAIGRLQQQRARLAKETEEVSVLSDRIKNVSELFQLAIEENATELLPDINAETEQLTRNVEALNIRRLFRGGHDDGDAFLTVKAGSGGTEAQDWAAMLFRMYWRYAERKGFSIQLMDEAAGEVAGIKGATVKVCAPYAYGYLRCETGIHRLVRNSPFDSNHRRHTSFASVFVFPVIDDSIEIDINPAELRIDTYRSSGAGGQHVNTTDSAVRITHIPTQIVVQCQNDRSQHKNRAEAMSMLRARLYQREIELRAGEKNKQEESKDEITWGRQIRSYVLDQSRVKDLRSGYESGAPNAVLDGDLDGFIRAELLVA